jgi:hypothetical protein
MYEMLFSHWMSFSKNRVESKQHFILSVYRSGADDSGHNPEALECQSKILSILSLDLPDTL